MPANKTLVRIEGQPGNYTPYGFRNANPEPTAALGFNGEFFSAALECYALGNGHRIYNPRLMRFISPDRWSPFLKGGHNPYAYCLNDPVNAKDPSGRNPLSVFRPPPQASSGLARFFSKSTGGFSNPDFRNGMYAFSRPERKIILPDKVNPLTNNRPARLPFETSHGLHGLSDGTIKLNIITRPNETSKIEPNRIYKYTHVIQAKTPTLVIFGARTDNELNTHPSGAELWNFGASQHVYAAGYIYHDNGWITIDGWSGHYRPEWWRALFPKFFLEVLRYKVRISNRDFG